MDKKTIESFRQVVKPFVANHLFETNYEGAGEKDKTEFERDFDTILDLAIKGIETNDPAQNIKRVGEFSKAINEGLLAYKDEAPSPYDMAKYSALIMLNLKEMNTTLAYMADVLMGIAKMMPTKEE